MQYTYRPRGTCSSFISLELTDGIVRNVQFRGGCHGNLQAVARLVEGMPAEEVLARCSGIHCGMRKTSCADQLAKAISLAAAQQSAS